MEIMLIALRLAKGNPSLLILCCLCAVRAIGAVTPTQPPTVKKLDAPSQPPLPTVKKLDPRTQTQALTAMKLDAISLVGSTCGDNFMGKHDETTRGAAFVRVDTIQIIRICTKK